MSGGKEITPLTASSLILKCQRNEQVYQVWFHPEVEHQPDTAWRIRARGFRYISIFVRTGRLRKGSSRRAFVVDGRFINEDSEPEHGHEIDGHGHLFFFHDESHAAAFVEYRKGQFAKVVNKLREFRKKYAI